MYHRLTPEAVAQTRVWTSLLLTDVTAPTWFPHVDYPTPEPLRAAARWLVERGHAEGMQLEMVCILLALYAGEAAWEAVDGASGGTFLPRDAA
jgi:hypothetical protein